MTLPQQQSGGAQSQHFLLKWNNHRSNMVNVFENLLQSENLVDVTIAVEGKFLKAHKIVLSACSPYFQSMFVNHSPSERYPILVFHDMKFAHLKTLLDFMYRGEISIDEKDLGEVLKVAEALSIRGLSSFESDDEESEKSEQGQNQPEGGGGGGSSTNNNNNNDVTTESPSTNSNTNTTSSNSSSSGGSGPSTNSVGTGTNTAGSRGSSAKGSTHYGKANGTSTTSKKFSTPKDNHEGKKGKNNTACDLSSNGTNFTSQDKTPTKYFDTDNNTLNRPSSPEGVAPAPPVKKKRGRQPKNKEKGVGSLGISPDIDTINATITNVVQNSKAALSKRELQSRFHPELKTPLPRQGVRRRLPRRFPGVPTRLKRVKLSKRDGDAVEDGGMESIVGGGVEGEDFMMPDLGDGPDSCEPLSEMSVRGLDLFKYASIEDGVYRCIECEKLRIPKTFKNKYSFQRHAFLYHEGNMRKVFPCPVCSREFSRPDKMKNHMRSIHEGGGPAGGGSNRESADNSPENVVLKAEGNDSCDV